MKPQQGFSFSSYKLQKSHNQNCFKQNTKKEATRIDLSCLGRRVSTASNGCIYFGNHFLPITDLSSLTTQPEMLLKPLDPLQLSLVGTLTRETKVTSCILRFS